MVKKITLLFMLLFAKCLLFGQKTDSVETLITYIGNPPIYKGDLQNSIQSEVNYPIEALKEQIGGTVIVSFRIDTVGVTVDHQIMKGIRKDLDDEALRVAKLIRFDKPAFQKDKPVFVRFVVPIHFLLAQTFIRQNVYGHYNIKDDIGIDDRSLLTEQEGALLNIFYQVKDPACSLCNKSIYFMRGNTGNHKSNKSEYFRYEKKKEQNGSFATGLLYLFDDKQKQEVGGYDAAVIYSCKKKLSIEKVIKKIKKQASSHRYK